MDWLASIFAEKAQQAQLITVSLSVAVAICVVLLNQWFLSKRAKKETLINKLEALYIAIGEYEETSQQYLRTCYSMNSEVSEDQVNKQSEHTQLALKKISLYLDLYFPDADFDMDKYKQVPLLTFLKYQHEHANRHSKLSDEKQEELMTEYSDAASKVLNHASEMKNMVMKLMESHKH
ncbi:hypothetical protein BCT77_17775 [Vibrio breoganii]|uniref:hypothetical protein n=1 Tax=Vibrio breoganii TaxID=553239 RepID=UPI000C831C4B|nr:hypothetical protein [Vibrio breoganii]PML42608.1 hypothetical protein BCT77_17775 [Vibrio breoganii]